jgi:hypothetical protein
MTLYKRLKPEFKNLIEKERKLYPFSTQNLIDQLDGTESITDLRYWVILTLFCIDGVNEEMRKIIPMDGPLDKFRITVLEQLFD